MKMKKQIKDPFDALVLDAYEQELESSISESAPLPKVSKKEIRDFAEIATKHKLLKSSKRINIRINNQDLAKVKAKAKVNNIPYQTLIGSLVHKYAEGDLKIAV